MPTLERCDCQDLRDALDEKLIVEITISSDPQDSVVYAINPPVHLAGEWRIIQFCPFCGRLAGDGLALRGEVYANNRRYGQGKCDMMSYAIDISRAADVSQPIQDSGSSFK